MMEITRMRIRHYLALAVSVGPILTWMFYTIVVIARGPSRYCPKCGGNRTRRSARRALDRFLPAFIAPRRCEVCRVRFHYLKSVSYRSSQPSARVPQRVRQPELAHPA
jgi:hypothetical protein